AQNSADTTGWWSCQEDPFKSCANGPELREQVAYGTLSRLVLLKALRSCDTPESGVVIAHGFSSIVERRRGSTFKRTGPRATFEFATPRAAGRIAPLPHIAAHVIDPVGAHTALITADCGRIPHTVLAHVALGWSWLISPWVDVAARPAGRLFPLLTGWQRLARPPRVGVRVLPSHEYNRVIVLTRRRLVVFPVLRRIVSSRGDETGVLGIADRVNVDVVAGQPDWLIARPELEHAAIDLDHRRSVDGMAELA